MLKKISLNGQIHYYINEGIHLSFLISYIFKDRYTFSVFRKSPQLNEKKTISTIWGNSCNSADKIVDKMLMSEFNMGDWLIFHNMGHYTLSGASNFNGFRVGAILEYNGKVHE